MSGKAHYYFPLLLLCFVEYVAAAEKIETKERIPVETFLN